MPVMDGLESTRSIREFEQQHKLPPALIIALTGLASAGTQQEAFASGLSVFLPGPNTQSQVNNTVGYDPQYANLGIAKVVPNWIAFLQSQRQ